MKRTAIAAIFAVTACGTVETETRIRSTTTYERWAPSALPSEPVASLDRLTITTRQGSRAWGDAVFTRTGNALHIEHEGAHEEVPLAEVLMIHGERRVRDVQTTETGSADEMAWTGAGIAVALSLVLVIAVAAE